MMLSRYGELLTGCIECNCWSSDRRAFILELPVEDIQALRELTVNGGQARLVR
jgi:hypothetical protein